MNAMADSYTYSDLIVTLLVLVGTALTLIGNIGLVRLKSFYERVHAPTLGATMGATFIIFAAIIHFWNGESGPVLVPILLGIFITLTTPISLIMLVRAALFRDRIEKRGNVPDVLSD